MTAELRTRLAAMLMAGVAAACFSGAKAADEPDCKQISDDVRTAVTNDPAKVLMIVEDALVINESCACEIVTAAIQAINADEGMKQQIVQTAVAVAPKMTPLIMDCVQGVAEGITVTQSAKNPGTSSKNPKNPVAAEPVSPPPPASELSAYPVNIRGVYLLQPASPVFTPPEEEKEKPKVPLNKRKRKPLPLSPSQSIP